MNAALKYCADNNMPYEICHLDVNRILAINAPLITQDLVTAILCGADYSHLLKDADATAIARSEAKHQVHQSKLCARGEIRACASPTTDAGRRGARVSRPNAAAVNKKVGGGTGGNTQWRPAVYTAGQASQLFLLLFFIIL